MTTRARSGLAAALAGVYSVCYPLIKLGLACAQPLPLGTAATRAVWYWLLQLDDGGRPSRRSDILVA